MSPNVIVPIVIAPLIVWRLYIRMRRNFGRQPIRPKRMWTRVAILSVLIVLFATQGLRNPLLAEWLVAGLICGVALGWAGLRFTHFEIDGSNDCYVPNPWIGLALTALLLARLLYRFMVLYPAMTHGAAGGYAAYERSPLTMAFFGLWFGYYIAYYAGLLLHHRQALTAIQSKQPS
ncbi:MAG: DUF1453 domain-containing protein [Rhodanobacteraceae bacterium]|nr:MAG: DUF1453 domain-containing protein [Rhodanobacteraceae bacterium]